MLFFFCGSLGCVLSGQHMSCHSQHKESDTQHHFSVCLLFWGVAHLCSTPGIPIPPQSFRHMAHFLVLVCNICAQWLSPRKECLRHCNLLGQEVVGLEIKIFVCVCHLSMDCSWEGPIRIVCNHSIQECKFAIFFWFKMNWMEASIELRWQWKEGTWSG